MEQAPSEIWLKAVYNFFIFHYRMPQTAAIATITPFIPSPLTVKFAMVASLLQKGYYKNAEELVKALAKIKVHIIPPEAAFSFKAFMRYRSVPGEDSRGELDESGSFYPSRPHTREYTLFQGNLSIFVGLPAPLKEIAKFALKNIRYLGCKDSLTWCYDIQEVKEPPLNFIIHPLSESYPGGVVLLADIKEDASLKGIQDIIPGQRKEKDYEQKPFTLPGNFLTKGRTRIFIRKDKLPN